MKVRKGDMVVVITGKHKGKKAKVLRTMPKKNQVVLEKLNVVKKHVKRREGAGEIIHFEMPLDASNVMVLDPEKNKATRVGYTVTKDGKKERIAKKSKKVIDSTISK